jgi:cation diffusion facilitator family transporter
VLSEDSGPKHSLWQRYLRVVSVDNQARKLSIFIGFMAVVFIFKLHISYGAESMALLASAYYTLFTLLTLATSLVALVANKQRSTLAFSYGYDRYELLMGFASGTLLVFVSLYVLFEGFEHILEPHEVNTNKLMLTSLFGMVAHVLAVVLFHDQIKLRTELATHSRMKSVEGLVRQLVTDVMPDLLLFVTSIIFYVQPIYWLESLIGWVIALHAMWTVIPYCVESGRILIQSVPQSIQYILEDTIRDATTVDGVLEVRRKKSHFWTFAPGVFVGTLHVRVKQDADVQQVLQQFTKLFSPIIQHLTVQVQKDDWGHGHKHEHQPASIVAF